jgi:hypothetical protein
MLVFDGILQPMGELKKDFTLVQGDTCILHETMGDCSPNDSLNKGTELNSKGSLESAVSCSVSIPLLICYIGSFTSNFNCIISSLTRYILPKCFIELFF